MAKVKAAEVKEDMIFEVLEMPEDKYIAYIGDGMRSAKVNIPVGTQLRITEAPGSNSYAGGMRVKWKVVDNELHEYWSFWSTFKKYTKYVEGEKTKPVGEAITSNGEFAGMDLEVNDIQFKSWCGSGFCGPIQFKLDFIGEFVGCKRLTTNLINQVKRSDGFKERMMNIISDIVRERMEEAKEYVSSHGGLTPHWVTTYCGGRVRFKIPIVEDDFEGTMEWVEELLDKFIESDSTSESVYLGRK
mgnify:CR=1 FL=1